MTLPTSVAESDGTGASLTVTLPGGLAAGDYALVVMLSVSNFAFAFPAGWATLIDTFNGTNLPLRVFGKTLTWGDTTTGSVTVTATAPGAGFPWMLEVIAGAGGSALRSPGGDSAGGAFSSVTGGTTTGGLYPVSPQTGDTLIYIGAGYAVPPPTPPAAIDVSLSAGSLLRAFPGTHASYFAAYLQLLTASAVAGSSGDVSVTATVTTSSGVGAAVVALYGIPPPPPRPSCIVRAIPVFGFQLQFGDGSDPETFTTVCNVTNFSMPSDAVLVDVTNVGDKWRRRMSALLDLGKITFKIYWIMTEPTHENQIAGAVRGIRYVFANRILANIRAVYPEGSVDQFAAYVVGFVTTGKTGDVFEAQCELSNSGEPVLV